MSQGCMEQWHYYPSARSEPALVPGPHQCGTRYEYVFLISLLQHTHFSIVDSHTFLYRHTLSILPNNLPAHSYIHPIRLPYPHTNQPLNPPQEFPRYNISPLNHIVSTHPLNPPLTLYPLTHTLSSHPYPIIPPL